MPRKTGVTPLGWMALDTLGAGDLEEASHDLLLTHLEEFSVEKVVSVRMGLGSEK